MTDDSPDREGRRRLVLRDKVAAFIHEYGKRHKYNDRRYDRKVEPTVKRMQPEELTDLLTLDGHSETKMSATQEGRPRSSRYRLRQGFLIVVGEYDDEASALAALRGYCQAEGLSLHEGIQAMSMNLIQLDERGRGKRYWHGVDLARRVGERA